MTVRCGEADDVCVYKFTLWARTSLEIQISADWIVEKYRFV